MSIGAFSVSLAVKDITASKIFYEKLGFREAGGQIADNWLIMRSDDCTIGLFQDMFPKNILTFNPGWNDMAEEVNPFKDVREILEDLRSKGIEIIEQVDPATNGPAYLTIEDPDGNPILIDQHR